jgi:hypothetical protein
MGLAGERVFCNVIVNHTEELVPLQRTVHTEESVLLQRTVHTEDTVPLQRTVLGMG